MTLDELAQISLLGPLLEELQRSFGGYRFLHHWQQGEFHHDVLVELQNQGGLAGRILLIATNCNAGVKELLSFGEPPGKDALWHHRCPNNPVFSGELPPILAQARTPHWFDPCELLLPTARSEIREEHREPDEGGGWRMKSCSAKPTRV